MLCYMSLQIHAVTSACVCHATPIRFSLYIIATTIIHSSTQITSASDMLSFICPNNISMGGGFSSLDNGHHSFNGAASQVITFHSEPQWIEHLEASKATTKLMVVDFTATWCGPCRWMEPAVNELAEKFPDIEFIKVDVDELPNVAAQFGVEVMPTFLLVRNGGVVDRIVGAKKSELLKKVVLHRNYLINN